MSSSPLTKVPYSALSPVSALSVRKHEQDKAIPQSLSKQALELQNTLNKLKEAQSKKKLSNSNIVISSINNPVSSPQKNKRTEEQEDSQLQYKSLFKDIESPIEQQKAYRKMNKNDAETMFEQRKKQIKQHINKIKSNCKNKQQKKQKPVQQIDFSKSRIIKQKVEPTPKQVPEKDMLHVQLKQMQKQLQSDIAKLDREIEGENQISIPFDTKNKGHELYQQGLVMEDRKQFKKKIYEREKQLKEMEECTFQPKISQPSAKNSNSRDQRFQQNQSKNQCKSNREQYVIKKQLSRSHSQDLINSTTTTQIINNDLTNYLNKVEDKYQQIMQKANALKKKAL